MYLPHWPLRMAAMVLLLPPLLGGCKKRDQATNGNAELTSTSSSAKSPTQIRQLAEASPTTTTKAVPSPRGPKLRQPERGILGEPPPPDPLLSRLQQEFDGITENDPRFFDVLRRLWNQSLLPEFDRHLQSATDEQVKSGELLPLELSAVRARSKEFPDSLGLEDKRGVNDAVRMLQALAALSGGTGGNHLPSLAESRANQLPPSAADLILYTALRRGIQEMNPSTNRPYLELWQPLATAKNPVYRLLALEAGQRAISRNARDISTEDRRFSVADAPAKVAFFRPFLAEQDAFIVSEALQALGALPSIEAKTELEAFRDVQRRAGKESLALQAEAALRTCDALLASTLRAR